MVSGAIFTAVGVYEPLVKFAGAGATVPLTGFGYSLIKGVEKAVNEKGAFGILCGGITGAGGRHYGGHAVFAACRACCQKPSKITVLFNIYFHTYSNILRLSVICYAREKVQWKKYRRSHN